MNPTFHPADRLLSGYGVGDLPLAPGLVVSAHLERCEPCRSRVRDVEEAEGRHLIEAIEPVDLASDALAKALKRLAQGSEPERLAAPPTTKLGDVALPAAVARVGVRKRRYLAPGLWSARVNVAAADDWRAFLLRVPPRTMVPSHGHSGEELVAVLAGSFRDGDCFEAGDFVECGSGCNHELTVGDAPCACLIAIRGKLLWKGWSQVVPLALDL